MVCDHCGFAVMNYTFFLILSLSKSPQLKHFIHMTKKHYQAVLQSVIYEFLCVICFAICHLSMHKQKLISQKLDETP